MGARSSAQGAKMTAMAVRSGPPSAAAADDLEAARAALAAHAWTEAYERASSAVDAVDLPADESPEALVDVGDRLDALAEAAWWTGRLDECISAREQAYGHYDRADASRAAGLCAVRLYHHWCFKGKRAIATGWLRRGRRALGGDVECAEYGFLLLYEAEVAHTLGELERAMELAETAIDIGRSLRTPDVEAEGLQAIGRLLIDQGRPSEGLAHLDEAMLFALEGRLTPFATGKVYCSLVSACHDLGDIHRANEWIEAVGSWAEGHPFTIFPGLCRLHRADLLQWRGEWTAAEAEARRACEELEHTFIPNAAAAFVEVGRIRHRLGDLGGAEEAFAQADALGLRPAAELALLRLSQGRLQAASSTIGAALAETTWNRLERARLLPVEVQIAIADDDLDRARTAVDELFETARVFESPLLEAAAASATGRLELALGDAQACSTLRQAVQRWLDLDAPYEAAAGWFLLAQACGRAGDDEGASAALAEAGALFERLGAALDLRAVRAVEGNRPDLPCGLTAREAEVLQLVATGCTNKQIAAELVISEKTVSRHLSNIFTKIDVSTRSAAAAFAFGHGLASD